MHVYNEVTKWTPGSKKPFGCPRQQIWVDRIKKDLNILEIDDGELATDRDRLRKVVVVAI